MKINVDQLAALNLLRDEGRISDEEYEDLEREIVEFTDVQTGASREDEEQDEPSTESKPARSDNGEHEKSVGVRRPGRWVTFAGGVAVVGIVLASALVGANNPSPELSANVENTPVAPPPTVPGSLGISLEDLTDLWNFPAEPPKITLGLVHNNEPGQYDSFIYRFGDWGRLAGAYDPTTDALYALLATGQLSHEATAQLYLHLCFVLNPYSQDCIDSYFEKGLDDGTLADFAGVSHQAQWQIDDQTWRLDIEGNVLTIRVLGAEVS